MPIYEGTRTIQIVETVQVEADSEELAMFRFIDDDEGVKVIRESEGDYECDYHSIYEL